MIIMGYVFAGLTIACLTVLFMDAAHLEAVWDHERQAQARVVWTGRVEPTLSDDDDPSAAGAALRQDGVPSGSIDQGAEGAEQPDAVPPVFERWSRSLTVMVFRHVLPRPGATRSGTATQVSAVVQSSFGTDPSTWYETKAYPNLWFYLPVISARALFLLAVIILALPLILPLWFLGQAQARMMLREAVLPKTHRFRWYRLFLYFWFFGTCTWICVPAPVSAVVVAPVVVLVTGWGINRVRVHGIEL